MKTTGTIMGTYYYDAFGNIIEQTIGQNNIIGTDGDFEKDTNSDGIADGWGSGGYEEQNIVTRRFNQNEHKTGRASQEISSTGANNGSNTSRVQRTITTTPGHIYYISAWFKTSVANCAAIEISDSGTFNSAVTVAGVWVNKSIRRTAVNSQITLYLMGAWGNPHTAVTTYIDGACVVDLTAMYGAGNEPTQAWCDSNIMKVNNSINYAGYQFDEETELYYLNSRYYDSKVARFISEDTNRGSTSDPLSLNLYVYCNNEPMMYSDPTGHWGKDVHVDDTRAWAREVFKTYLIASIKTDLNKEKLKIIVYKVIPKGIDDKDTTTTAVSTSTDIKIVDKEATEKEQTSWMLEKYQEIYDRESNKISGYVDALVGGDDFVDLDANYYHNGKISYSHTYHGYPKTDYVGFVNDRNNKANDILKNKGFGGVSSIKNYVSTKRKMLKGDDAIYNPETYFDNRQDASLFIFGMGLHTEQDTTAHAHQPHDQVHSDKTKYKWDGKKWVEDTDLERLDKTIKDTKKLINTYLAANGSKLFNVKEGK